MKTIEDINKANLENEQIYNERTTMIGQLGIMGWYQYCTELGIPSNSELVCPECKNEIDISEVISSLREWGETHIPPGWPNKRPQWGSPADQNELEVMRKFFQNRSWVHDIEKSSCVHLRFFGFCAFGDFTSN